VHLFFTKDTQKVNRCVLSNVTISGMLTWLNMANQHQGPYFTNFIFRYGIQFVSYPVSEMKHAHLAGKRSCENVLFQITHSLF